MKLFCQNTKAAISSLNMEHNIIEFIGPPGVGKSTIYRSLCKTWTSEMNWIYQDELLSPEKPSLLNFNEWLKFNLRKSFTKKTTKNLKPEHGIKFISNHPTLADTYWKYLSDSRVYDNSQLDKRFRSTYFLFNDFCRYQAVIDKNFNKPCIINEGLLQKSFYLNNDTELMQEILSNCISLVPLPKVIVYINSSNAKTILSRLKNRDKIIASHSGKNDEELLKDTLKWQLFFELLLGILDKQGVKILNIDGEKSVDFNTNSINKLLNTI